jgi:hypothetical protein
VKLKNLASFFSFFLVKPLYEVYIIRIKEQVGERMSTVCSHKYVDCLLENRSREHIKCVFNEKLEHVDDFSFRELVGRIRMVIYKVKYVPFRPLGICIYIGYSFFMKHSWTNIRLEWEIVV